MKYKVGDKIRIREDLVVEAPIIPVSNLADSGARADYTTGATREPSTGKGRYDLISPIALMRLARHYENGAIKYTDRNWEKGIPISRCIDSAMRHLTQYMAGWNNEDHLAAVMWNIAAIMHFEELNPDMQDVPSRKELK